MCILNFGISNEGLLIFGISNHIHNEIKDLEEAKAFLQNPYLGKNLKEISEALLELDSDNATQVMGIPDNMKLKSSMTLFACADPETDVFEKVLEKFYNGQKDGQTLKMLSKESGE